MEKVINNFQLYNKTIQVIQAEEGAYGANMRFGKVLDICGKGVNNDLVVLMEDDHSIWNVGDIKNVKYKMLYDTIHDSTSKIKMDENNKIFEKNRNCENCGIKLEQWEIEKYEDHCQRCY